MTQITDSSDSNVNYFETIFLPNNGWDVYWSNTVIGQDWRGKLEKYGDLFLGGRLTKFNAAKFIIFRGPPGTGKTTLAKGYANYLAHQLNKPTRFLQLNAEVWRSNLLGKSPQLVSKAFQGIRMSARQDCTIVLIDELESIAISRNRVLDTAEPSDVILAVNQLLTQIDRLNEQPNLLVIATTNLQNAVDNALLGRTDLLVPFNLPDIGTRLTLLKIYLSPSLEIEYPIVSSFYTELAKITDGLSGRDISKLPMHITLALNGNKNMVSLDTLIKVVNEIKIERMSVEPLQRQSNPEGNTKIDDSKIIEKINRLGDEVMRLSQQSGDVSKLIEAVSKINAEYFEFRSKMERLDNNIQPGNNNLLRSDLAALENQMKDLHQKLKEIPVAIERLNDMDEMINNLQQELDKLKEINPPEQEKKSWWEKLIFLE